MNILDNISKQFKGAFLRHFKVEDANVFTYYDLTKKQINRAGELLKEHYENGALLSDEYWENSHGYTPEQVCGTPLDFLEYNKNKYGLEYDSSFPLEEFILKHKIDLKLDSYILPYGLSNNELENLMSRADYTIIKNIFDEFVRLNSNRTFRFLDYDYRTMLNYCYGMTSKYLFDDIEFYIEKEPRGMWSNTISYKSKKELREAESRYSINGNYNKEYSNLKKELNWLSYDKKTKDRGIGYFPSINTLKFLIASLNK